MLKPQSIFDLEKVTYRNYEVFRKPMVHQVYENQQKIYQDLCYPRQDFACLFNFETSIMNEAQRNNNNNNHNGQQHQRVWFQKTEREREGKSEID